MARFLAWVALLIGLAVVCGYGLHGLLVVPKGQPDSNLGPPFRFALTIVAFGCSVVCFLIGAAVAVVVAGIQRVRQRGIIVAGAVGGVLGGWLAALQLAPGPLIILCGAILGSCLVSTIAAWLDR
jgi:hypothetical protein